mmetsp:Transcript_5152/g.11676  ORF Transcript_5152/g.11676 Transcript_5152/m.11676 type:complete len:302 (+) Transcript_5152:1746-2651(+)
MVRGGRVRHLPRAQPALRAGSRVQPVARELRRGLRRPPPGGRVRREIVLSQCVPAVEDGEQHEGREGRGTERAAGQHEEEPRRGGRRRVREPPGGEDVRRSRTDGSRGRHDATKPPFGWFGGEVRGNRGRASRSGGEGKEEETAANATLPVRHDDLRPVRRPLPFRPGYVRPLRVVRPGRPLRRPPRGRLHHEDYQVGHGEHGPRWPVLHGVAARGTASVRKRESGRHVHRRPHRDDVAERESEYGAEHGRADEGGRRGRRGLQVLPPLQDGDLRQRLHAGGVPAKSLRKPGRMLPVSVAR